MDCISAIYNNNGFFKYLLWQKINNKFVDLAFYFWKIKMLIYLKFNMLIFNPSLLLFGDYTPTWLCIFCYLKFV